jgi:CBS domain containing-hemolysin-like protein
MSLLIFYGLISVFFSFLCSVLEAVLLSVTPTYINIKKSEGKAYASSLEALKKDVDKPLIAILTLNTVAHTVGAILVGVQAEKVFGTGDNSIMIVSAIMTILILVASEIIPKTIGATYWKQLASFSTRILDALIFFFKWTGIIWTLQLFTRLFGKNMEGQSVLSREDFHAMTDIAHEEGVFQESESTIIKNLINFKEILAKDIMTPRTVMKTASEKMKIQAFYDENPKLKFSRIPIYGSNMDEISGYFLKDDLLEAIIKGNGDKPLKYIQRELLATTRNLPIPELFNTLIEEREHIALVVDEYGSVSGLVTQEDVIETLLGFEIMDESDNVADLQKLARMSWETRAKRLGIIEEKKSDEE